MTREFMDSDQGKPVVTYEGDKVGTIDRIDGQTAHIKPTQGLAESTRQKLGVSDEGQSVFEIDHSKVDSINDVEVRLQQSL